MSEAKKSSPWVWISLFLIIGLFVVFILFLDQNIVKNGRKENTIPQSSEKTGKPVFDFYTVLPQRKVEVQVQNLPADQQDLRTKAIDALNSKKSGPLTYIVQAGSFNRMQDADRRKAELALLGLESSIKSADVKGKTYYRVEMGPLSDSQYSKIQRLLISNDLDFFAKPAP